MTSPEPLPVPEDDALDAAVSAVVDGVATPQEAALVAAAPDGRARVEATRTVASAVGSRPGVQGPAAAQRAMAAALAALDSLPDLGGDRPPRGARGAGPDGPPLTRLPVPPASARSGRGLRFLGVAAALLLVVGLGAFSVAALRSDSADTPTATAFGGSEHGVAGDSAARSAAPDGSSGGLTGTVQAAPPGAVAGGLPEPAKSTTEEAHSAPAAPPVVDGGDIGRQDGIEVVTQRVAAALAGVPDAAVASPTAAVPSDVQACATAGQKAPGETPGPLRYRAAGTFGGIPAIFLAYDRPGEPPRLLLVLARSSCTLLATTQF